MTQRNLNCDGENYLIREKCQGSDDPGYWENIGSFLVNPSFWFGLLLIFGCGFVVYWLVRMLCGATANTVAAYKQPQIHQHTHTDQKTVTVSWDEYNRMMEGVDSENQGEQNEAD